MRRVRFPSPAPLIGSDICRAARKAVPRLVFHIPAGCSRNFQSWHSSSLYPRPLTGCAAYALLLACHRPLNRASPPRDAGNYGAEMSDNSVVVSLNQFERSRRSQVSAATLSILHACRDLLIEGATRVLTRQTEAMETTLLAMAERSPLLETRNAYYAAQTLLNKQSNELLSACKDVYCTAFNDFVQGRDKNAALDLSKLSLVDDQDFEITLVLDKATSRLRFNCAEELVALDARIAHLLGRSDLSENDSPLGPRTLCEALLDGITRMGQEQGVRVVLLNQFDLVLTTELAQIYQSINHL